MCKTPCEPERTPENLPESTHLHPRTEVKPDALTDLGNRGARGPHAPITDLQQWIDLNA